MSYLQQVLEFMASLLSCIQLLLEQGNFHAGRPLRFLVSNNRVVLFQSCYFFFFLTDCLLQTFVLLCYPREQQLSFSLLNSSVVIRQVLFLRRRRALQRTSLKCDFLFLLEIHFVCRLTLSFFLQNYLQGFPFLNLIFGLTFYGCMTGCITVKFFRVVVVVCRWFSYYDFFDLRFPSKAFFQEFVNFLLVHDYKEANLIYMKNSSLYNELAYVAPIQFQQRMINLEEFDMLPDLKYSEQLEENVHEEISVMNSIDQPNCAFEHSANILDHLSTLHSWRENEVVQIQNRPISEDNTSLSDEKRDKARMKNETKNIPKNFGKGIITFIERKESHLRQMLKRMGVNINELLCKLHAQKREINTIADLRILWTQEPYGKCMRVLSNLFFRKHALQYIFNSRISNYSSHIKYRQSLWQAIRKPEEFNRIKEY